MIQASILGQIIILRSYVSYLINGNIFARCPISLCSEQELKGYVLCDGTCPEGAHIECSCPEEKKIPMFAIKFIQLQRCRIEDEMEEVRRLSRERRLEEEQAEALNFLQQVEDDERERIQNKDLEEAMEGLDFDEDGEDDDDDEEFLISKHKKIEEIKKTERNMSEMPLLGFMANKFRTSPREASLLVSAALVDLGFVTAEDSSKLVDRGKVSRAKERVQKLQQSKRDEALLQPGPKGLYLDSRGDKCLARKEIKGRVAVTKENPKEDHYTVLFHPADKYQDCTFHITVPKTPPPGVNKAQYVADLILQKCHEKNINMDEIILCGGDSTPTNTGVGDLGGVFLWLERFLEKNLMWCVCSIHILELTPKNLFTSLDGPTASGTQYTGGIGQVLKEEVMKLEIDPNFVPLPVPVEVLPVLPQEVLSEFSSDQLYLYTIAQVVRTGTIPVEFQKYTIGPLNDARWNTRWSRLLRLYISKRDKLQKKLSEEDEENLKLMVNFLMFCYIPAWFEIRLHQHLLDAPTIFLNLMTRLQSQPEIVRRSVEKTLQTGSYSLYEETLLQRMLCSDDPEDRRFAIQMIIKNRERAGNPDIGDLFPQKRINPKLNFDSRPLTFRNVIDWNKRVFREPPLTCKIPTKDLWSFLDKEMEFPANFPNHTQSVERLIKRVTEAGQHVATEDRRDGVVLAQLEACRMLPVYETKKDLVKLTEYANTYKKPRRDGAGTSS